MRIAIALAALSGAVFAASCGQAAPPAGQPLPGGDRSSIPPAVNLMLVPGSEGADPAILVDPMTIRYSGAGGQARFVVVPRGDAPVSYPSGTFDCRARTLALEGGMSVSLAADTAWRTFCDSSRPYRSQVWTSEEEALRAVRSAVP